MATSESSQGGLQATTYAEEQEHAIVGGVAAKKVFPIDLPPTAQTNGTVAISQTDNVVASTKTHTKVIGGITYTRTLSYNAAGLFLNATAWS